MRIAIIGCGFIGRKRALSIPSGHAVKVVVDKERSAAESLAKELSEAKVEIDPKIVCKDPDIDAVFIAVTHKYLAKIALEAINHGKHVFIEKPASRNANEFRTVVESAQQKGITLKVGYNHRFHPAFIRAKNLVDEDIIGPLILIRARYGHGGRLGYEKEWRAIKSISGGGELIDQGSHLIDLSLWFLGSLKLKYGTLSTLFWDMDVEDNCFLSLEGQNNQQAWLHASWTEWKNKFSFEIYGKTGKIQIDGLGGSYGIEKLTLYKMLPEMGPPNTTSWEFPFPDKSWELETSEFLSSIEECRQPVGNGQEALEVLKIIDETYKNAKLC